MLTSVSRFGGLAFDPDTSDPMAMKSTVWFNNKGRHALPSFYNALSNSMLRAALSEAGVTDPENFGKLSFYFISAVNFCNFEISITCVKLEIRLHNFNESGQLYVLDTW